MFLLSALTVAAQEQPTPVIPAPQVVVFGDGVAALPATVTVAAEDTTAMATALAQVRALVQATGTGGSVLHLGLPAQDDALAEALVQKRLWPEARIGEEGYVLSVDREGIVLGANTAAGVFYGVQTLKQLVRGYGDALPVVRIVDWPALRYRGLMDDISRGPVPTLDFMKQQVRRLAEMKLNVLTYYTEHVAATEKHRAFAPADGGVSLEEWRELAAYARAHHVTLVGNFQSFGHFENILAHPAYEHLGESNRLLSPVLPESEALLRDLYAELVPAFGAPFFHVNSDETWDLGRGYSKVRVDSLGAGVVYAEHAERMHALLQTHGVRMWLWADVVLLHPEILDRLPKDIVLLTWNYSPHDTFEPWMASLLDAGFDVMVCPGVLNSNRVMPPLRQAVANIRGFVGAGVERDVMGMLNTVWDDGGTALFSMDWYGVATGADAAWRNGDAASFDERFSRGLHGDPRGALAQALNTLDAIAALEPTNDHTEQALWQQLLPERGQRATLSTVDWDRVAALADSAQTSLQFVSTPYPNDRAAVLFVAELYRMMATSRFELLRAAEAYRTAVLRQSEAPAEARGALRDALAAISRLQHAWLGLEKQYGQRWLAENRTYALDRVLDRLAEQRADLTDVEARLLQALRDFDMGQYLSPPTEVRLAISESSGRFFREWLVAGPLPNPNGSDGTPPDYLGAMGGEQYAQPGVAVEFDYGGTTYRWQRLASPLHDIVDLAQHYPQQNRKVTLYAYATIDAPVAQTARALVGSNDGVEVFLNGERVFQKHVKRNLTVDEDAVRLPLRAGRNHLLLKISQGAGGWGFAFRLPDYTVRSRKHRYRIVS